MLFRSDPDYCQQQLTNQNLSGLTQAQWCEQNNINIHNFRYWRNRLSLTQQKSFCEPIQTKWALVTSSEQEVFADHNAPSLRVYIGKALIEVSDGFNSKSLSDVITVLMQHV